jgi:Colicin D
MKDPATKVMKGRYRKYNEVTHYLNETTGLNVMINNTNHEFISGWKLEDKQLNYLINQEDFC